MDQFNRNELAIELRAIRNELADVLDGARFLSIKALAMQTGKAIAEVDEAIRIIELEKKGGLHG